jgi:hypothetical protein
MKINYEVYEVGSSVWAISRYNDNKGKETDHCAIYQAKVKTVYIQMDKKTNSIEIEYWLETPSGEEWGCEVNSKYVSDSFEELVETMKTEWVKNSNIH